MNEILQKYSQNLTDIREEESFLLNLKNSDVKEYVNQLFSVLKSGDSNVYPIKLALILLYEPVESINSVEYFDFLEELTKVTLLLVYNEDEGVSHSASVLFALALGKCIQISEQKDALSQLLNALSNAPNTQITKNLINSLNYMANTHVFDDNSIVTSVFDCLFKLANDKDLASSIINLLSSLEVGIDLSLSDNGIFYNLEYLIVEYIKDIDLKKYVYCFFCNIFDKCFIFCKKLIKSVLEFVIYDLSNYDDEDGLKYICLLLSKIGDYQRSNSLILDHTFYDSVIGPLIQIRHKYIAKSFDELDMFTVFDEASNAIEMLSESYEVHAYQMLLLHLPNIICINNTLFIMRVIISVSSDICLHFFSFIVENVSISRGMVRYEGLRSLLSFLRDLRCKNINMEEVDLSQIFGLVATLQGIFDSDENDINKCLVVESLFELCYYKNSAVIDIFTFLLSRVSYSSSYVRESFLESFQIFYIYEGDVDFTILRSDVSSLLLDRCVYYISGITSSGCECLYELYGVLYELLKDVSLDIVSHGDILDTIFKVSLENMRVYSFDSLSFLIGILPAETSIYLEKFFELFYIHLSKIEDHRDMMISSTCIISLLENSNVYDFLPKIISIVIDKAESYEKTYPKLTYYCYIALSSIVQKIENIPETLFSYVLTKKSILHESNHTECYIYNISGFLSLLGALIYKKSQLLNEFADILSIFFNSDSDFFSSKSLLIYETIMFLDFILEVNPTYALSLYNENEGLICLFPKLAAKQKYYNDFFEMATNLFLNACRYGYSNIVRYLIALRGIIEARDEDEKNGFQIAAENDHSDICKILTESTNTSETLYYDDLDKNSSLCITTPV